jgi:hypothetical protein
MGPVAGLLRVSVHVAVHLDLTAVCLNGLESHKVVPVLAVSERCKVQSRGINLVRVHHEVHRVDCSQAQELLDASPYPGLQGSAEVGRFVDEWRCVELERNFVPAGPNGHCSSPCVVLVVFLKAVLAVVLAVISEVVLEFGLKVGVPVIEVVTVVYGPRSHFVVSMR